MSTNHYGMVCVLMGLAMGAVDMMCNLPLSIGVAAMVGLLTYVLSEAVKK